MYSIMADFYLPWYVNRLYAVVYIKCFAINRKLIFVLYLHPKEFTFTN